MGKVNEYSVQLLEDWGDSVDIYYTQFLEVAFFLKVAATREMAVAFVTAATNYQVTVRAGGSHILYQAEEAMIAEADTTPNFPTLEDLVTVEVRPSATTDVQVEVFAALV